MFECTANLASKSTQRPSNPQCTLFIIKPDVAHHSALIEQRLWEKSFQPLLRTHFMFTIDSAMYFYRDLDKSQAFYAPHIAFMTRGPCVAYLVTSLDPQVEVVSALRELVGPTDPQKAPKGTLRGDMGFALPENAVHASSSVADAKWEALTIFSLRQLLDVGIAFP
jgi:nucleoside-diphosphate kinase